MALTSAAVVAQAEIRSGTRAPQFTMRPLFALTSSTANDLINHLLIVICLRAEFSALARVIDSEVMDGGTRSR